MVQIDIHNYEAYLLDFSEGNLTDELQMELELFLIQHPELNIDLTELSLVSLKDESIVYSHKSSLKKTETDLVSEKQFVAYIENQLSEKEIIEFERSCALNPTLTKELAIYIKTIVKPDTTIVYPSKNKLKRKPKVIWFNFSTAQFAAAASVVLLFGLYFFWPSSNTNKLHQNNSLAQNASNQVLMPLHTNTTLVNQQKNAIKNTKIEKKENSTQTLNIGNQVAFNNHKANTIDGSNLTTQKDSSIGLAITTSIISDKKDESSYQMALHTKTVVEVITESDDDVAAISIDKKKRGFWALAGRALKNLNAVGVKAVNGDEKDSKENTSYALTLGGVNITHKAGNL
jgi:hypothetical protein